MPILIKPLLIFEIFLSKSNAITQVYLSFSFALTVEASQLQIVIENFILLV